MSSPPSWTTVASLAVAALGLVGCAESPKPELEAAAHIPLTWSPPGSPTTGFETASRAGMDAFRAVSELGFERRTSFSAPQRTKVLAALEQPTGSALGSIDIQWNRPSGILSPPGGQSEWQQGLRLIGMGLGWRVNTAAAEEDQLSLFPLCTQTLLLGAKIADGDGSDASLGFHLASSTAKEVGRSLDRMTAEDLEELSYGAEQAARSLPDMAEVLERERLGAMLVVQEIQDAYLSGSAAELQTSDRFGRTVTGGVKSLQRLKPEEARAWFEGLRNDVGSALDHEISQVGLPLNQREEWSPESSGEGWASFVQHAVGSVKPLMDEYDRTLCRLRLLSIEAAVRVELIRTGAAPLDLSDMPSSITTDPFSGREFCYESSGAWHKLYSTGPDGRNDGGGRGPNGEEADFGLLSGAF